MSYQDDDNDDDFDYDEFVEREFGTQRRSKSVPLVWQFVAMGLVAFFVFTSWMALGFWTPF